MPKVYKGCNVKGDILNGVKQERGAGKSLACDLNHCVRKGENVNESYNSIADERMKRLNESLNNLTEGKSMKYVDSISKGLNDLEAVIGRVYEDSVMDWVESHSESEVKKMIKLIDNAIVKIESM